MEGWGCLNQKEKKENHEFLNPIVGFRAVQAAAVAAGFSNAVIETTCRVGVRRCRVCACFSERERLTCASAITFTPRAAQLNSAAAGRLCEEPLVFGGPLVCCLRVCGAHFLGGRSKRAN